jgi:uncharacterized lipoprotein YmbA
MRRLCRHWIAVATVVLTTACGRMLPPQPDPSRFFVLTAMDPPTADPSPTSDQVRPLALVVGPVRLAPYLDRNDLAIRLSADEIRYSDGERWAEPLERNVTNVLALNLSRLLGTARVFAYPQPAGLLPAYQIDVEIGRLDTTRAGEATLAAHWTIENLGTRDLLASRDSYLTRAAAGTGTPAAVAALSNVLAELSQEIASTVRALPRKAA